MNYGLLGILSLLPFVSPLPARAEETPEAAVIEETQIIDPCLICPLPAVQAEPTEPAPAETLPPPVPLPTPEPAAAPEPVAISAEPTPIAVPETAPAPAAAPVAPPATTDSPVAPSLKEGETLHAPTAYPAHSVLINEFVSDPVDGVEWIELMNTTEDEIDLTGWTVKDATTSKTLLPAQFLPAHAFFVLQNPKGRLNNDGDSIFLFDGTGATIDAISYDKTTAPKKGKSLARTEDGLWKSSDPTPLALNTWPVAQIAPTATEAPSPDTTTYAPTNNPPAAIPNPEPDPGTDQGTDTPAGTPSPVRMEREPQVEAPITAASAPLAPPTDSPVAPSLKEGEARQAVAAVPVIDAAEIINYAANDAVTVEGVLVAAPGIFGKQVAYVDGLEIYFNKAEWPKLSAQTRVRVTGTVDVKEDYTRLKIKKRTDIKSLGEDAVAPDPLETLDDVRHGLLMSVTGTVVDVSGKIMTLSLENGDLLTVSATKDAAVDFSELAYDDHVSLTGITLLKKGVWTIHILESSGLTILQDDTNALGTVTSVTNKELPSPVPTKHASSIKSGSTAAPWLGGGLLTTSVGALGYWFAKARGITLPSFS